MGTFPPNLAQFVHAVARAPRKNSHDKLLPEEWAGKFVHLSITQPRSVWIFMWVSPGCRGIVKIHFRLGYW